MKQIKLSGMSARTLRRVSDRYSFVTQAKLQKHIERFFQDTVGKSEGECRVLHDFYDKKWQNYALIENKYRPYTVFGDAFESSIAVAWKKLLTADKDKCQFDLEDAKRVCDYFRVYTKTEKFWMKVSALFTKKESKTKKEIL